MLAPQVDDLVKKKLFTPEKKDELYTLLKKSIKKDITPQEKEEYVKRLEGYFDKSYDDHQSVSYKCKKFITNDINDQRTNQYMLTQLLNHIAYQDLHSSQTRIKKTFADSSWTNNSIDAWIDYVSQRAVLAQSAVLENTYLFFEEIDAISITSQSFLLDLWDTIKESPSIKHTIPDVLTQIDHQLAQTILEKSLTNPEKYATNLIFFPSPEAIRNLILLASAEYKYNRTGYGNDALSQFAQRADWKEILDKTCKKYPQLSQTRPLLEHWNRKDMYSHDDELQKQTADFALSIINDPSSKPELITLGLFP